MIKYQVDIIKQMRNGHRLNVSKIARDLNQPMTTISDRIRQIEKHLVKKHSAIINFKKLGYKMALVGIKTEPALYIDIIEAILKSPYLNTLFKVDGFDFMVEALYKDEIEFASWMRSLKARFKAELAPYPIEEVIEKERFMPY